MKPLNQNANRGRSRIAQDWAMNKPKWMMTTAFVGGALLLASCGGGEAPAPQPDPQPQPTPTEQAGTVLGTITPFAPGKASVAYGLIKEMRMPPP